MDREQRQAWVDRGCKDPVAAYQGHKASAASRGIDFDLTFDEWWAIWEPRWGQRGSRAGQMQMCRTGDRGGYWPGNVRIDTREANMAEAKVSAKVKRREGASAGWLHDQFRRSQGYFKMAEWAEEDEDEGDEDYL
jgi:hypothetical protein